jgi:LysR family transcriptional regulator for bpeEF and oprC
VASREYLRRNGTPAHPSELEDKHTTVNYFSSRTGRPYAHLFEKDGELLEVNGRYQLAVNEANASTAAVLAGLGIGQIGAFGITDLLSRGELVPVLADWARPPIPLHIVYPPNRHLSAKVRAFVEWATELFARHPGLQA